MPVNNKNSSIAVGCSGFSYSSWRGNFYPQDATFHEMFPLYASRFNTLEVNSTYYGFIHNETLESWLSQASEGFLLSFKVPRFLIQAGVNEDLTNAWNFLKEQTGRLRERGAMGALLFQLPRAMEHNPRLLEHLLDRSQETGLDRAFDFVHPSWFRKSVFDLLSRNECDIAAVSRPDNDPFLDPIGKIKYFRFSGVKREGLSDYSITDLAAWGEGVEEAAQKVEKTYVYFNNTGKGSAPINATALIRRILKASSEEK